MSTSEPDAFTERGDRAEAAAYHGDGVYSGGEFAGGDVERYDREELEPDSTVPDSTALDGSAEMTGSDVQESS